MEKEVFLSFLLLVLCWVIYYAIVEFIFITVLLITNTFALNCDLWTHGYSVCKRTQIKFKLTFALETFSKIQPGYTFYISEKIYLWHRLDQPPCPVDARCQAWNRSVYTFSCLKFRCPDRDDSLLRCMHY